MGYRPTDKVNYCTVLLKTILLVLNRYAVRLYCIQKLQFFFNMTIWIYDKRFESTFNLLHIIYLILVDCKFDTQPYFTVQPGTNTSCKLCLPRKAAKK